MSEFINPKNRRNGRPEVRNVDMATPAQMASLTEMKLPFDKDNLTFWQADSLIRQNIDKWNALPATGKQRYRLECAELWDDEITRGKAAKMIGKLKAEEGEY